MGGMIPLGDASRRPRNAAAITLLLIAINVWVFLHELEYGNRFVRAWAVIPFRSRGKVTIKAPITAAMAPLAPRQGMRESGSAKICASMATMPPAR